MTLEELQKAVDGKILANKIRATVDGKILVIGALAGKDWVKTEAGEQLAAKLNKAKPPAPKRKPRAKAKPKEE